MSALTFLDPKDRIVVIFATIIVCLLACVALGY